MPKWNQATERLVWNLTAGLRMKRNQFCLRELAPNPDDTVLDLGSEDGGQLASFYPYPDKVTLADINERRMKEGVKRHGFAGYVVLDPEGPLPLPDQSFDLVYCSSVIEHVTTDQFDDETQFLRRAREHQELFCNEIRRVGRRYFVQTPNRHFPIESHALLPFAGYLPAKRYAQLGKLLKRVWIKQFSGGCHLLTRKDMERLFPEANIFPERFMGLVKSWIAAFNRGK